MKKQLDTSVMENELRSGSAFFRVVPPHPNEPETAQPAPSHTERKDVDSDAAVSVSSPIDTLPAIKPPQKAANLAPVVPLERTQSGQTATPPPLSETSRQMGGEGVRQMDSQRDAPPPVPVLNPTPLRQEETNEGTNEPSNERTNVKRQKIRHTFDIYADQLLSLKEIQLNRARVLEQPSRLGDLVQEAFDAFITNERNKE